MLRRILAVIAGIIVFVVVVSLMDTLSHQIYPMPEGLSMEDEQAMAAFIAQAPFSAMLVVMLGWILGTLAGTYTASKLSPTHKRLAAGIVGALAFAGTSLNAMMLPHPIWMLVVGLAGIAVMAHVGWKLGDRAQSA